MLHVLCVFEFANSPSKLFWDRRATTSWDPNLHVTCVQVNSFAILFVYFEIYLMIISRCLCRWVIPVRLIASIPTLLVGTSHELKGSCLLNCFACLVHILRLIRGVFLSYNVYPVCLEGEAWSSPCFESTSRLVLSKLKSCLSSSS